MPRVSIDINVMRVEEFKEAIRNVRRVMIDLGMGASRAAEYMWAYGKVLNGPKLIHYRRYRRQYERRKNDNRHKSGAIHH